MPSKAGSLVFLGWFALAPGCTPHAPAPESLAVAVDDEPVEEACRGLPRRTGETADFAAAVVDGERDAVLDVALGTRAIEVYALPRFCLLRLSAGLLDRHAVYVREVGRCTVDGVVVGHARGYNAKMREYIEREQGAGVLEAAARAADCLSETSSGLP